MDNFFELNLPQSLQDALASMAFATPTSIQAQTIPAALNGTDILGTAQTGTGKTAAYGIPLIAHLLTPNAGTALVLTPTRELAVQVLESLTKLLGSVRTIHTALLIGGDPMVKQLKQLRRHPKLIVATPGRLIDHLTRKSVTLHDAHFLVLDEIDRMLDLGFSVQLQKVVPYLPSQRQTLMFSATLSSSVEKMAHGYLNKPLRISVGSTNSPVERIKQETLTLTDPEKYDALVNVLNSLDARQEGAVVVFVKTKHGTEKLADRLNDDGHLAEAIHGDLRQSKRERVIKALRAKKFNVLVATDVAARGLDISHIECVVNYDLPQCPEDYIHRVGRTGRAGAEGRAVSFLTHGDRNKWRDICRLLDIPFALDSKGPRGSTDGQKRFQGPRPHGSKGNGPKGYAPRSNGDRPYAAKSWSRDSQGSSQGHGQERSQERSHGGANGTYEKSGYKGSAGRGFERANDRPDRAARPEYDRPASDRARDYGDRPSTPRPTSRPFGDRPNGGPSNGRPGDKPRDSFGSNFGRPAGPRSDRPAGPRSDRADRPAGPRSDKPSNPGGAPYGKGPSKPGAKPFKSKFGGSGPKKPSFKRPA